MMKLLLAGAALLTLTNCGHTGSKEASPVAASEETTTPAPTKAHATFTAANGQKIKGIVHFTEENGSMKIETRVDGLKPGPHGYHIHEKGDCSAKDFSSAGGHFNPATSDHGALDSSHRHVGDLGNLIADKNRKAYTTLTVAGMTMKPGNESIIGKSIIIHKDQDDLKSQPAGNSGARIACAVIEAL